MNRKLDLMKFVHNFLFERELVVTLLADVLFHVQLPLVNALDIHEYLIELFAELRRRIWCWRRLALSSLSVVKSSKIGVCEPKVLAW